MRIVITLLCGIAIGWFARPLLKPTKTARTERVGRGAPATTELRDAPGATATTPAANPATGEPSTPAKTAEPAPTEPTTAAIDPETQEWYDEFKKMMKLHGPQMRAFAAMQSKQRIAVLLAKLNFDEETSKRIEAAIAQAAESEADRAWNMMLGEEEFDESAVYWFQGIGPKMPAGLERELSTFLTDADFAEVRDGLTATYQETMVQQADMQIQMLGISDLSDTQRTELRDVFGDRDKMTEDFGRFAKVLAEPQKMREMIEGDGLEKMMEQSFAPRRERVRNVLSPEQYKKWEAFEKNSLAQARMMMQMWGATKKKK